MSKLASQWIDIFRAGDYGAKGKYSTADLQQIATDYSQTVHDSPVTVGHPQSNLPAFGWVEGLRVAGDVLQAKIEAKTLDPAFEEMVEAGRFKQRSASIYPKGSAASPTGRAYLRHIGFLGAQPPEVKGLRQVQFHDEGQEAAEVVFEEESAVDDNQKIDGQITAWFKKTFGGSPTETRSFSEAEVSALVSQQVAAQVEAQVKPLRDQIATQTLSFSEAEKAAKLSGVKTRAANAIAKLKSSGRWVPAFDRLGLPVVFEELATAEETVEFGEGDEKKTQTPLDFFVSFMEEIGKIVPTAPVYTGQPAGGASPTRVVGINDSQRAPADPNSMNLHNLTQARAIEQKIDYGTALAQIAAEKPELTVPGGAAAGQV